MSLLISALSLARERELGTFEQLLVTPLRPAEILIGKALPGIIVGLINANIVIAAALLWFRAAVPRRPRAARGDAAALHAEPASASGSCCRRSRAPSSRRCWACSYSPRR